MNTLPLQPELIDELYEDANRVIVVDFENSAKDVKTSLSYLTNLNIKFAVGNVGSSENKVKLVGAFINSKFDTEALDLRHLTAWLILRNKGLTVEDANGIMSGLLNSAYTVPAWLTIEEADSILATYKEQFDLYCEYFDSATLAMLTVTDAYGPVIKAAVESGELVTKKDDGVGINIMLIAGMNGFIEVYSAVLPRETNTLFELSTRAGRHLLGIILEREENSTMGLLYLLGQPAQEAPQEQA